MLSRTPALEHHGGRTVSLSWLGFKLQRQLLKENRSSSLLNICPPVPHISQCLEQDMKQDHFLCSKNFLEQRFVFPQKDIDVD